MSNYDKCLFILEIETEIIAIAELNELSNPF